MFFAGIMPLIRDFLSGKNIFDVYDLAFFNNINGKLAVVGIVGGETERKGNNLYLRLDAENVSLTNRGDYRVHGKVLVKTSAWPKYFYGEKLRITCNLRSPDVVAGKSGGAPVSASGGAPASVSGPADSKFSYDDYLAKDGIYSVCYNPKIDLIADSFLDGWGLLFDFKRFIGDRINRLFGAPAAGLVGGILIGTRSGVPDDVMDSFNRAGLTHILAISGYNITLLINIMAVLARSCGRRARLAITNCAIVFFCLLTGMSASVVRASLMGAGTVLALSSGRKGDALTVLTLSGCLMVLVNNRILLSDISFQLSYLSTLGLILLMPFFESVAEKIEAVMKRKLPSFVADGLMVTVAAQIFTTPITLYYFGRISLISLVTNILFLPIIPLIMALGFAALASSIFFLPFTALFVGLCWICLEVLVKGVDFFASIPFASIDIKGFDIWALLVYYSLLAAFIFYRSRSEQAAARRLFLP